MGVSLVKEISKKTSDQIVSFGEILSSQDLKDWKEKIEERQTKIAGDL